LGNGQGSLQKRNGVWQLRITDPVTGKRPWIVCGTDNRDEAEQFRRKYIAERRLSQQIGDRVSQLHHIQAELQNKLRQDIQQLADIRKLTMRDIWHVIFEDEGFLDVRPDVEDKCKMAYKRFSENFVKWYALKFPTSQYPMISDVTTDMAKEFLRHIERTKSANERNRNLCWMRQAYNILMEKKMVFVNPFRGIPNLKNVRKTKKRILSSEEMKALMKVLATKDIQTRGVFLMAIETGQRLGDCCMMKWEYFKDVHTSNGDFQEISFQPHKTKKKTGKVVNPPVTRILSEYLKELKNARLEGGTEYLFPRWAETYSRSQTLPDVWCLKIIDEAGIVRKNREGKTDCGMHSMRHSYVQRLASQGVAMSVLMGYVGHTQERMTEYYAEHRKDEVSADVVRMLDNERRNEERKAIMVSEDTYRRFESTKDGRSDEEFLIQLLMEYRKHQVEGG